MSKDNNKVSSHGVMESYYKMIGEAHVENIVEELSLQADDIHQVQVPKSLDEWFEDFNNRRKRIVRRKKWTRKFKKISSKVAMILIVFVTCMTIVTFSVKAFRMRVFNFFSEEKGNYTEIQNKEDDSKQSIPVIDQDQFFYLSYLPFGYRYDMYATMGDEITITYTNGEERINFIQSIGNANYQIDTEDALVSEIPIGEASGKIIKKEERIMLFWADNEYSFLLKAALSEEEIIKMARSLKKNK